MTIKRLFLLLLLFVNGLCTANAQIRTISTNVNVFGDTITTYNDGSSVKKSTNIFGDKIVTVTESDNSVTEIKTNSFGNTTKKTTTPDGQSTQAYSLLKEVNVFGDKTTRYTDGTSIQTSKDIFDNKIITVTQNGQPVKTIKISTDTFGNETKTVTKANE
ncbi:hypothetical protein LJ707_16165 [Mucilaginibacter sp. UR6-1]|uniref:hypothetical protein n=1 Tax=Mucilaginibacter sp. UR6-1 TaxID=1435643 RepID=UPI001E364653|nr:hypothetical protein [Mucilaginibacter sp. UR6-1]MCC8410479.1 hypothetical protein [Mucilaginibacter sp. UR6-1]